MRKRNVKVLVLLLTIGFAAVSTSLILNGTVGIGSSEDDFDVIFTSAEINGEDSEVAIDETKKKITFTSSKLTSVGEKAIFDYKVKNTSTQYDADVTISCNNYGNDYIEITGEFDGNMIPLNEPVEMEAQEEKSGVLTAELVKSSIEENDSVEITCTIVTNATERDNVVERVSNSWKITEDNDNNGDVSKGDLITLGTESFYVYNTEGGTIKALAKYNLEVGNSSNSKYPADEETNIQSSRAMGYKSGISRYATVEYSKNRNNYAGSIVEGYVNNYVNILKERYDVEVTGRLITKEELKALGCDANSCTKAPSYIYSTSYWTSSAVSDSLHDVWSVSSNGSFGYYRDGDYYGVRPVIGISKSLFE